MLAAEFIDLYEVLQLSPNAEKDTIRRIQQVLSLKYQLAAAETNAKDQLAKIQHAAATLLDDDARAAYDEERQAWLASWTPELDPEPEVEAPPVVELPVPAAAPAPPAAAAPAHTIDHGELDPHRFMEGLNIAEEKRRRAGLMEICYRQRILKPRQPALSMKQLEDGMELTVDQLEGCLWYLKETDLVRVSDAGNYAITPRGMDAIEGGFVRFADGLFDMKSYKG